MDDIRQELAALRAEIAELKAATRRSVDPAEGAEATRRQMLIGAAAAVMGGAVASSVTSAEAANGQAMILGSYNNIASLPTGLIHQGAVPDFHYGFGVIDQTLDRFNSSSAIAGHTQGNFNAGVLGYDTSTTGRAAVRGYSLNGYGVSGGSDSADGIGVYGFANNGTAMYAWSVSDGSGGDVGLRAAGTTGIKVSALKVAVHAEVGGSSPDAIGVLARAYHSPATSPTYPTALAVSGVHRATRVGRVIVPAGARSVRVAVTPLTATSVVLATPQKVSGTLAVAGVTIRTIAPTAFTITLTGAAPAGGLPVGWFVVDMMGTALD